ncbi:MAG: iron ABC transporter permease [Pseudomonadota bacterium]
MATGILGRLAWLAALICVGPILAAALAALTGDLNTWTGLIRSVLPGYALNTLLLVVLVGLGTAAIGTGAAWLVTMYRFPGSRILDVLLVLPLAFPAYVLAYAYTYFLQHSGPVQTGLRDLTGLGPRDYWFPDVQSLPGAALMLIFVLYPYVYLLVRTAFSEQSRNAYYAARTLGQSSWGAFSSVSLPMARPAIAGGALLCVMETIADYGTVSYFAVQTFSTGIYQAWFSMGDRGAAAQLALCLLSFALLLAIAERVQRGRAKVYMRNSQKDVYAPHPLRGPSGLFAFAFCFMPVLMGFLLPLVILLEMAIGSGQNPFEPRYVDLVMNSLTLAGVAALVTICGAVLISFRSRTSPGPSARLMTLGAGLGYAVPGGVIAVGILVPLASLDNVLAEWIRAAFGVNPGLIFTGSIWVLVLAYMSRFMAAGLNTLEAGYATVSPSLDAVARTLGQSQLGLLIRVHLPILKGSILTAILIVFVDTMKELPATMIMRPFNFDTLAVQAHRLAADERLHQAAVPSLVIVAVGLLPVFLVCRQLSRSSSSAAPETVSEAPRNTSLPQG